MGARGVKPKPVAERFAAKTIREADGCLRWLGKLRPDGYGELNIGGRAILAHRVAWDLAGRPVARELDHLCRHRWCVEVEHLESVSHRENVRRGEASKLTVCTHDPSQRYWRKDRPGGWNCRACRQERREAARVLASS